MLYLDGKKQILVGKKTFVIENGRMLFEGGKSRVENFNVCLKKGTFYFNFLSKFIPRLYASDEKLILMDTLRHNYVISINKPHIIYECKDYIIIRNYDRIEACHEVYYKLNQETKINDYYYYNIDIKYVYFQNDKFYYGNNDVCFHNDNVELVGSKKKLPCYLMQQGQRVHDLVLYNKNEYFQFECQTGNYFIGNAELFLLLEMIMKVFARGTSKKSNKLAKRKRIIIPKFVRYIIYQFVKI